MYFIQTLAVVLAVLQVAVSFSNLNHATKRSFGGLKMVASPGSTNEVPHNSVEASANFRKFALPTLAAISLLAPFAMGQSVLADDAPAASTADAKPDLGPPPTDFGLDFKDYYADSVKVVNHMRYGVQLEKGNPRIAEIAQKVKDEMLDYVAYYRRFQGINGKQSYSLLYTSINVLAGHYTSYGVKFPVPEKRRKRLLQEFNDIEKNIRKKR